MRSISKEKYNFLVNFLQQNEIQALIIADYEDSPSINLRYLSGQPSDGMFLITSDGESFLIPWDMSIAEKYAEADEIFDISNYEYNVILILKEIIKKKFGDSKAIIGICDNFPYGYVRKMKNLILNIKFFKEPKKIGDILRELRATKSDFELKQLMKAAERILKILLTILLMGLKMIFPSLYGKR